MGRGYQRDLLSLRIVSLGTREEPSYRQPKAQFDRNLRALFRASIAHTEVGCFELASVVPTEAPKASKA
jgi:hypothetical protein